MTMAQNNSRAVTILKMAANLPTAAIIQLINGLIAVLQKRGENVLDFENWKRELRGVRQFGPKIFFLATKKPEEATQNGDNSTK